jgi:hypothetical protein
MGCLWPLASVMDPRTSFLLLPIHHGSEYEVVEEWERIQTEGGACTSTLPRLHTHTVVCPLLFCSHVRVLTWTSLRQISSYTRELVVCGAQRSKYDR